MNRGASASATNYPTPRSAGPLEWVKDQLAKLRTGRTARGAYEETGSGADGYSAGGAGRSRGRGLEDDAWDTRVGNEDPYGPGPGGYHEEQELGLAPTPGLHNEPYGGGAGSDYVSAGRAGYGEERGTEQEPRTRQLGSRTHSATRMRRPVLRSVSPRPEVDTGHTRGAPSLDPMNTSPTSRRSMFREGL